MITKLSTPARSVRPASRRLSLAAAAITVVGIGTALSLAPSPARAATPATSPGRGEARLARVSPGDAASGGLALNAYETYIQALVASAKLGRERDAKVVSTVASTCPSTLAPLSGEPSTPVRQAVLANFGEEIGGDLELRFQSTAARPFRQLSTALGTLEWSSLAPAMAIKRLLSAERTVLRMPQSALCANAAAVAASPKVIPLATQSFIRRYRSASANLSRRLHTFLTVLQRYETPADQPVVSDIDTLVAQYSTSLQAAEETYSQSILSDLGLVPAA